MGQVCDAGCYNERDRSIDSQFQLAANRQLRSSMCQALPIQQKIITIGHFIDGLKLSEQMKNKYTTQLLDIRQELIDIMLQHTDKYNSCCCLKESVQGFIKIEDIYIPNQWLDRGSLNSNDSYLWNPQDDANELPRTRCQQGKHLNECMDMCLSHLKALEYNDRNTSKSTEQLYACYILEY